MQRYTRICVVFPFAHEHATSGIRIHFLALCYMKHGFCHFVTEQVLAVKYSFLNNQNERSILAPLAHSPRALPSATRYWGQVGAMIHDLIDFFSPSTQGTARQSATETWVVSTSIWGVFESSNRLFTAVQQ